MWHIGLHVWQIPQREMEPDLDEYYGVRIVSHRWIREETC